jgi:hypothetical protein
MTSIIKVDNLQNQCGANIINENAGTITIGASGDTVTLAAGASQSGFGRSGSVNWDTTPKTANFTGVSGEGYFVDTTSGAITIDLPATPSAGDIVAIADYNGTATTNNITVGRNSSNINGDAADFTISKNYAAISFVYVDATAGWRSVDTSDASSVVNQFVAATGGTIATCGNYKIHTFTGPGTFTVTNTGPGSTTVDYLVVAGGGGGAPNVFNTGGGGAGGFRESVPSPAAWTASPLANPGGALPVSVQGYPITVGAGGTVSPTGVAGGNSVFSTITSAGGGGARDFNQSGLSGGSGSGSGGTTGAPPFPGGAGNTPPVAPPQGNTGGTGASYPSYDAGGGGGGAGGIGLNSAGPIGTGGDGGAGVSTSISSSAVTYSNGGVGSGTATAPNSPIRNPAFAANRTANQGDGAYPGFNGGSGIVVIRYKFQ